MQGGKTIFKTLFILAIIPMFCIAGGLSAADNLGHSGYAVDFVTYRAPHQNLSLLEILCEVPAEKLQFVKSSEWYVARYEIFIEVQNSLRPKSSVVTYRDSITVSAYKEIAGAQPHLVRIPLMLPPQEYSLVVRITDMETLVAFETTKRLAIADYWQKQTSISDLQLATALSNTDSRLGLIKNKMFVKPCVSKIFAIERDSLFVYSELYNMKLGGRDNSNLLRATLIIQKKNGDEVKRVVIEHPCIEAPTTFCAGIPINDLKAGDYTLMLTISGDGVEQQFSKSTTFKLAGGCATISDEDFNTMVRQLAVFASLDELNALRELPRDQRDYGLASFWQKKDPIPETTQNELKVEFLQRLNYANEKFIYAAGEGWESDQGSVYLKCGEPNHVDRYKSNLGYRTYEIWEYVGLNRKFVFVDIAGFGEFRLLNPREDDDLQFLF
jgi:GWxTD domain-containing protein